MKICKSFFEILPFNKIPVFWCRNYSLSQVNPALQPDYSVPFTKVLRADLNRSEAFTFPRSPQTYSFPGGTLVKNLPAKARDARDLGTILGFGRPLEEEMATHSSILAWKIAWPEEPGRLQTMGSQRVIHN